uniref:Parvin gamma n=1 Tax=Otus sunia TaxID=257818 RepID=A0A8C8AR56_9STRI
TYVDKTHAWATLKRKVKHNIALSALLARQESNCQLLCFPPQLLIDWVNTTLKEEHIVVRSLEEDLYDGLVLHHLLENLGSIKLDVDKIALTEKKQRQKLSVILEAVAKCLQLEESQLKWSVESIFTKDLLSTLHLLVAIAKHFTPSLAMPPNVQVETITIEVIIVSIFATVDSRDLSQNEFLDAVKKFADGVILLLLIGQLEGYFLNLRDFFLTPASTMEMVGCYLTTRARGFKHLVCPVFINNTPGEVFIKTSKSTVVCDLGSNFVKNSLLSVDVCLRY